MFARPVSPTSAHSSAIAEIVALLVDAFGSGGFANGESGYQAGSIIISLSKMVQRRAERGVGFRRKVWPDRSSKSASLAATSPRQPALFSILFNAAS